MRLAVMLAAIALAVSGETRVSPWQMRCFDDAGGTRLNWEQAAALAIRDQTGAQVECLPRLAAYLVRLSFEYQGDPLMVIAWAWRIYQLETIGHEPADCRAWVLSKDRSKLGNIKGK